MLVYKKRKMAILDLDSGKRLKLILLGSAFAFILTSMILGIIFNLAFFFSVAALKIMFNIVLVLVGIVVYYILITEFVRHLQTNAL